MPQVTVTHPVFGSAGQASGQGSDLHMDGSSAEDFDLLAEYLLDEAPGHSGGMTFDFK
jgi:hypothetical protein